jgi:hypothetical protein
MSTSKPETEFASSRALSSGGCHLSSFLSQLQESSKASADRIRKVIILIFAGGLTRMSFKLQVNICTLLGFLS